MAQHWPSFFWLTGGDRSLEFGDMNLVTQKQFSEMVKLSPQAISKAVGKNQLMVVQEGNKRKIDLDAALTQTYIQNRSSNRAVAQEKKNITKIANSGSGENGQSEGNQQALPMAPTATNVLRDNRLKLQNAKLEIDVQNRLGKLIDREIVTSCFDKMSVIILNYFNPLSTKISPKISTIYEIVDQEKRAQVEKLIQKEISNALGAYGREIKEIIETLEAANDSEAS